MASGTCSFGDSPLVPKVFQAYSLISVWLRIGILEFLSRFFAFVSLIPVIGKLIDSQTLILVTILRLGAGTTRLPGAKDSDRPREPIVLYDLVSCPYCRRVREVFSMLDIDYIVKPCPKESMTSFGAASETSRFRNEVKKMNGSVAVPYMVDPNTGVSMGESADIMAYLWKQYGNNATTTWNIRLAMWKPYMNLSYSLISFLRPQAQNGIMKAPSNNPEEMLELYGFENSSCVLKVQERLCCLELPYKFIVTPLGSTEKRDIFRQKFGDQLSALRKRVGVIKVPLLVDSNRNLVMTESSEIVKYLQTSYQRGPIAPTDWLAFGRVLTQRIQGQSLKNKTS